MMKLENFVGMMTGHFDNKDQFKEMQAEGRTYPYAEHVNTICNDKINNLPEDFKGKFVVEESYYEMKDVYKRQISHGYVTALVIVLHSGHYTLYAKMSVSKRK